MNYFDRNSSNMDDEFEFEKDETPDRDIVDPGRRLQDDAGVSDNSSPESKGMELPGGSSPRPGVMTAIAARTMPGRNPASDISNDPMMQQYEMQQNDLSADRSAQNQASRSLAFGQIGAQMATGGQSQFHDNGSNAMVQKQGSEMLKGREEDMDRRQKIMSTIEARNGRQAMHSENVASRAANEQGRREDRNFQRDMINDRKESALAVPGYERTGEVTPKVEEAANFRKATAQSEKLVSDLGHLRKLVEDNGSFEWSGPEAETMRNLSREIQLTMKSPEMYNLGVLSGPDLRLLEQLTSDPKSVDSFFTQNKTRLQQIDNQLHSVKSNLASKSKSMGYKEHAAPKMTAENEKGGIQTKPRYVDGVHWKKVPGGWEEVE